MDDKTLEEKIKWLKLDTPNFIYSSPESVQRTIDGIVDVIEALYKRVNKVIKVTREEI